MYNLEPSDVMELFVAVLMFEFKSLPLCPSAHRPQWKTGVPGSSL